MAVAEVTEKEIANYEMPSIREGAPVRWYRYGTAENTAVLGFVTKVKSRSVVIWTTHGLRYDNVRHISDPKLRMDSDQRADGAWDYTEDYKAEQEVRELRDLVKKLDARRIAAMEKLIDQQGQQIEELTRKLSCQENPQT